jgi:hypothetical protein
MLVYLVQCGLLPHDWVEDCPLAVWWMKKQIWKRAESLDPAEWMKVTYQDSKEFVTEEFDHIYHPSIEYFGDLMRQSGKHHGSTIDCFVFAKLYLMDGVVLYIGDSNPNIAQTLVLDGQTNSPEGNIHPHKMQPRPGILELVSYMTDVEKLQKQMKSGQTWMSPLPYVAKEKGPGHYIFVK